MAFDFAGGGAVVGSVEEEEKEERTEGDCELRIASLVQQVDGEQDRELT